MRKLQKILIMAGGTGGHVFPGLAVAKQLRQNGVEVHWLGTPSGLEAKVIPPAGIPIHYISISGLRGKSLGQKCLLPFKLLMATIQAFRIIRRLQPNLVLGMGGFVSGPGGIASWILRKPLIIHEQNAKAGLTNKWLARLACKVLEGFPNTFPNTLHAISTGNPVRDEISRIPAPELRFQGRTNPMRLLIIGGSLGANVINHLIPSVLAKIPENMRPMVYHQTGEKHFEGTVIAYQRLGVTGNIVPFITDMESAYSWADLVLCRAGALTIAELCAAGLGSVLVPYPFAADDHQTANAAYLVKHQAALLIQQVELTENSLVEILKELSESSAKRMRMAKAAYSLRQPEATINVLKFCEEISD